MKIGEVLKAVRYDRKLNQRELAKEIGVLPSTICRIENGKSYDAAAFFKIFRWLFG